MDRKNPPPTFKQIVNITYSKLSQYLFFDDLQSLIKALDFQPEKCDYNTLTVDCAEQVKYIQDCRYHFNYLGLVIFGVNLQNTHVIFNEFVKYLRLEQVHMPIIPNMNQLLNLQRLEIISNQVNSINKNLPCNIEYLDLSFNIIKRIKNINHLKRLLVLNLSYNCFIDEIYNIDNLIRLKEINLSNNRILTISGMDNQVNLTTLDLSSNRLTQIENLDNLVNLEHLYLNNNKIHDIENLNKLTKLKTLSLASNRIHKIQNLKYCVKLIILDLRDNLITVMENFERNKCLQELTLMNNRIIEIDNIFHLKDMTKLILNNNPIIDSKIEEIQSSFPNLKYLKLPSHFD